MKNIAIITARGGSKRIPKKNIREFLGKPIIAYSIEAAIKSNIFDEVMVSTDSKEIADIAIQYGAKVPFIRSEANSNDFAGTVDVLIEVLKEYEKMGKSFNNVCCIYPTAPFVTSNKLKESLNLLIEKEYDSVMPVASYPVPSQWAMKLNKNNKMIPVNPESILIRSQDLEKTYYDVGQFYWGTLECIVNKKTLNTDNTGAFVVSELEIQDIDNEQDWQMAELKYKLLKVNG